MILNTASPRQSHDFDRQLSYANIEQKNYSNNTIMRLHYFTTFIAIIVALSGFSQNKVLFLDGKSGLDVGKTELSGTELTVESLVYPTQNSISGAPLVLAYSNEEDQVFSLWTDKFEMKTAEGKNATIVNFTPLPTNEWTHIAATYNGSSIKIFINGLETQSKPIAGGTINQLALNTEIGILTQSSNGIIETFDGYFDEVRIWNTARTKEQISGNQTNLPTNDNIDLKLHFSFNDGINNQANPITPITFTGSPMVVTQEIKTIDYTPNLFVPNAFTPDNDGINDFFSVKGIDIIDFEINVYARSGEKIYSSKDPNFKWDGTKNAEALTSGFYAWDIKVTQEGRNSEMVKQELQGSILLLK